MNRPCRRLVLHSRRLKPIDRDDYAVTFTSAERARLRAIFADGVCDYSRRGVEQVKMKGTWLRF